MNVIILILIAAGIINSADQFTAEFQQTHTASIAKANYINDNHLFIAADGGVVIDDDVNPEEFE